LQNDTNYQVQGLRNWAIIGNEVDPGQDQLNVVISAPSGTKTVDGWLIDGTTGQAGEGFRFQNESGSFQHTIDLTQVAPGEHELRFAANGESTAFRAHTFQRSHPLYVIVTTDWDDADTSDLALSLQDDLHAEHPELLLTHFVGPYTFTDPELSEERRGVLVSWLKGMRDDFSDEIGLHIHPYCNFVTQVGTILGGEEIECKTKESTVYSGGDTTGYTVRCSAYSQEEFTRLLLASDVLFEERGLGKPTSFRAGGWTAELHTIKALEAAGYVADTSALNWARMEEWDQPLRGTLYDWNKEHWATINDTSQPYYPSVDDILVTGPETINVLEVPDNGIQPIGLSAAP
jgi:hypothetical protein